MPYFGNTPENLGGVSPSLLNIPAKDIVGPTYSVLVSDQGSELLADASGVAITVNLPPLSSVVLGFTLFVKKVDSSVNTVVIDGNSGETINGQATITISNQWDGIGITKGPSGWFSFASSGQNAGSSGGGGGLTPGGGSDPMPGGTFDIGISSAASLALPNTSLTNSYQYTGTGAAIVFGALATNIDGTGEVEITMVINDFSNGTDYYTARNIPVPADSALELLKRPKVLKPNDRLKFQANSANDANIYIRYHEFDLNTDLDNMFYAAGTDAVGGFDTMYTEAGTTGSVFESLLLANMDGTNDVSVSVRITDGGANPQLTSTLLIPAKSSIELAEVPIVLLNGDTLDIEVSDAGRLHVVGARREF